MEHPTQQEFLYRLQLVSSLHNEHNWTDKENGIIGEHFSYLQKLLAEGKLVLAGRTTTSLDTTFGLAIFRAASQEEAQQIMENDPAVSNGVMTAELFPYHIAIKE